MFVEEGQTKLFQQSTTVEVDERNLYITLKIEIEVHMEPSIKAASHVACLMPELSRHRGQAVFAGGAEHNMCFLNEKKDFF